MKTKYARYQTKFKVDKEDNKLKKNNKWINGLVVYTKNIKEAFQLAEDMYGKKSKAEIMDTEEGEDNGEKKSKG